MNIKELHNQEKEVSAMNLFKSETATATAIQLKNNGILKEHITITPALLICVSGLVKYEDEKDAIVELKSGDYVLIMPNIKTYASCKC
jgi:quercetin dioxygenase-like cupin family protein